MSLYHEAASFLTNINGTGTLASRVYGTKTLKSKPTHIYALVSEATKWGAVLSEVVEKSEVLKLEKKLTPALALLLTHDLLLAKSGIAAPKEHGLRLAVERHKARLRAELTKARLEAGYPSVDAWRAVIESSTFDEDSTDHGAQKPRRPRWVRINTLRTTIDIENTGFLADYEQTWTVQDICRVSTGKLLAMDAHVPNLIAFPDSTDFSKSAAYRQGKIIFQDKASCFPAYLLDPQPEDGDIIDACAAPGNKTTHLAALLVEAQAVSQDTGKKQRIYACERDNNRAVTLQKMVHLAGADDKGGVECLQGQDFLRLNPQDPKWRNVGALLLDPSCSGSGIVGRDENEAGDDLPRITLPRTPTEMAQFPSQNTARGKKRKRAPATPLAAIARNPAKASPKPTDAAASKPEAGEEEITGSAISLTTRLASLSAFQLKILTHAFAFPSAHKIVYSTCSIHVEENEGVVLRALASSMAKERGWRVLRREEQARGLKEWGVRGDQFAVGRLIEEGCEGFGNVEKVTQACLRCEKGTEEGTMGFFVVGFVRNRGKDIGVGGDSGNASQTKNRTDRIVDLGGQIDDEEEEDDFQGFSEENEA